ncbi:MAG: B12-binding domain-containing radical SAM protein [bacterium]|nr:B12-binding domain-containing radical SAM protein [bacterium]
MQIALVATYTHPIALGLRYVSAFLKHHGHDARMIFMSSKRDTPGADFSPALLADFVDHVREADLIGMSLMTNTFVRACVLTEALRKARVKAPIVWGGTHPTVAADESLEQADMVCVGEGEHPMLELARTLEAGKDPTGVGSIVVRRGDRIVRNPVIPLEGQLDDLPFPDYDLDSHWIPDGDRLVQVRPERLRGALNRYRLETTRGCPYPCTFCNNAALLNIYRGKGAWVRKRSTENVLAEIDQVRRRFPSVEAVNIVDDLFFIRSEAEIDEFAQRYAREVNLPLELDAFPNTITEQKVRSLCRVPLSLISMGIQSGSPDTLKNIYGRPTPVETIAEGIGILSRARVRAEYHYLVGNPFEPEANFIQTLRFAATHHRGPAIVRVFPLQFYPGTPLYDRARADGLIGERHESAYRYMYTGKKYLKEAAYLEIWLRVVLALRGKGIPSAVVHGMVSLVLHPFVRRLLDRKWFAPACYRLWRLGRTISKNLIYQPFVRPFRYLRRRRPRYEELHPGDEVTLPRNKMPALKHAAQQHQG